MADNSLPLLDDNPSATPLDLLLNAISGTGGYNLLTDDTPANEEGESHGERETMAAYLESGEKESNKRPHEEDSPRQNKIARTLSSHFASVGADGSSFAQAVASGSRTFSTIEVWHPKTGQKSYAKERRLLQPPPTLRVTGPLLPLLTNITMSAHPNPDTTDGRVTLSTHSHRFALNPEEPEAQPNYYSTSSKKEERDEKKRLLREAAYKTGWGGTLPWERNRDAPRERAELEDGISFPGLWISEEVGKNKEFRLELSVGQPGVEEQPPAPISNAAPVSEPLDESALHNVLSATEMAPLMNLNEAEASTPIEGMQEKANHGIDPALAEAEQSGSEAPVAPTLAPPAPQAPERQPWATFASDPLSIVSKPSQKTAKARSMASCLSDKDAFSLYVRVNGQTVRTKYLKLDSEDDQSQLAARVGKWSPFRFEIVQRALPPHFDDKLEQRRPRFKLDADREANIITYGSIVCLVDVQSNTRSDPMRLVRIDKNSVVVGADEGHPVSELQRVGLVRLLNGEDDLEGGGRWYLSAPGATTGAGEVSTTRARPGSKAAKAATAAAPLPETLGGLDHGATAESPDAPRKKRKTKRHALARAAIEEEEGSSSAGLVWSRAERKEGEHVITEGKVSTTHQATIETVDDWMCWVLTGVSCFSYSFFNGLGDSGSLPAMPLNPVPRLLMDPFHRPEHNAINLTLSHFYIPDATGQSVPLSVYLGPIGPLKVTTWRSVAPKEKFYNTSTSFPAVPYSGNPDDHAEIPEERRVYSNFPYGEAHVIAMVELPEPAEIIRVMRECGVNQEGERPQTATVVVREEGEGSADDSWLGVMGHDSELTIQEALRNAGHGKENSDAIAANEPNHHEFSLEQLPQHLIDPSLAAPSEQLPETTTVATPGAEAAGPSTIAMYRQERPPAEGGMVPLPLLVVRPDGVGHGLGWSVMAQRGGDGVSEAPDSGGGGFDLGLCVVQSERTAW